MDVYIEPFCGTFNTAAKRPLNHFSRPNRIEIANDINGYMVNVFRAIKSDPEGVIEHIDNPSTEIDLIARYQYLAFKGKSKFVAKMKEDPNHYNSKRAGWFIWGLCLWIGIDSFLKMVGDNQNKIPELYGAKGILKRVKTEYCNGQILASDRKTEHIRKWIMAIHNRYRYTVFTCGSWKRVVKSKSLLNKGTVGVFLDPPYPETYNKNETLLYGGMEQTGKEMEQDVYNFCLENGSKKNNRIAVCGYDDNKYNELLNHNWHVYKWKTKGGYASQVDGEAKKNRHRECIWFSPYCRNEIRGLF